MQSISWKSPSNIAIVKYWGKHGRQLPRNCSLSFTLDAAHTLTKLSYSPKKTKDAKISLKFYFEGKENPSFGEKSAKFLASIVKEMPFLVSYDLKVETRNTFPHSSGIASSASGMSALALCICQMEILLSGRAFIDSDAFRQRTSYFARLGSGSACRSVYPTMASWGKHPSIEGSSDEYATPVGAIIHESFKNYHDDILIVSKSEKSVSSTAGHGLMEDNPYADARYQQANDNIDLLLSALKSGDHQVFGEIAESEALTLHALMMCSSPSYILLEPNTLEMIRVIRAYRQESGLPVYFTLDAGPNIHLLYPNIIKEEVNVFINQSLKSLCQDGLIIRDQVGLGAKIG